MMQKVCIIEYIKFSEICDTVDHILIGRSHIGRAPNFFGEVSQVNVQFNIDCFGSVKITSNSCIVALNIKNSAFNSRVNTLF